MNQEPHNILDAWVAAVRDQVSRDALRAKHAPEVQTVSIGPDDDIRIGDKLRTRKDGRLYTVVRINRELGVAALAPVPESEIGLNRAQRRALRKRMRTEGANPAPRVRE